MQSPRIWLSALALLLLLPGFSNPAGAGTVTDMRGVNVALPADIQRVATISDGFVEGVMTHLGVIDKVVAIGSWAMKRDYVYTIETISGETLTYRGWHTMKFLHPRLDALPCVVAPQGFAINFETLAVARPDVVIIRAGDCVVNEREEGKVARTVEIIEAMGIPLIVLFAPKGADISTIREEMAVLGEVFGQREKAVALADYLAGTETFIRERTADIPDQDKTRLLYLGLNPDIRKKGGAGSVWGVNTPESYIIENIANAKNAFSGQGSGIIVNMEQIYALDPDAIVLPTSNGYHSPRTLYEAPYFAALSELRCIRERRVYAMPWTPMNCARRVEYPLDMLVIAKAAYPERFADLSVYAFALEFYRKIYHVDEARAKGLRSTQLLDWMAESGF